MLRAADDLAYTRDYKCLSAAAGYLSTKDSALRQAVLLYMLHIPAYQPDSPPDLGASLLAIAYRDPDPYFRKLAGKVILQIGDAGTKALFASRHARVDTDVP